MMIRARNCDGLGKGNCGGNWSARRDVGREHLGTRGRAVEAVSMLARHFVREK